MRCRKIAKWTSAGQKMRAMTETKRQANSQVVGLVFGPNSQNSAPSEASATLQ